MIASRLKTALALLVAITLVAAPILQAADQAVRLKGQEQKCVCCAGCSVDSYEPGPTSGWKTTPCPCKMKDRGIPASAPLQAEIQRPPQTDQQVTEEEPAKLSCDKEPQQVETCPLSGRALADRAPPVYLTCCSFLI